MFQGHLSVVSSPRALIHTSDRAKCGSERDDAVLALPEQQRSASEGSCRQRVLLRRVVGQTGDLRQGGQQGEGAICDASLRCRGSRHSE
jgi:hypothetical protein